MHVQALWCGREPAEHCGNPVLREASKTDLVLIDRENAARTALIGEFPRLP